MSVIACECKSSPNSCFRCMLGSSLLVFPPVILSKWCNFHSSLPSEPHGFSSLSYASSSVHRFFCSLESSVTADCISFLGVSHLALFFANISSSFQMLPFNSLLYFSGVNPTAQSSPSQDTAAELLISSNTSLSMLHSRIFIYLFVCEENGNFLSSKLLQNCELHSRTGLPLSEKKKCSNLICLFIFKRGTTNVFCVIKSVSNFPKQWNIFF